MGKAERRVLKPDEIAGLFVYTSAANGKYYISFPCIRDMRGKPLEFTAVQMEATSNRPPQVEKDDFLKRVQREAENVAGAYILDHKNYVRLIDKIDAERLWQHAEEKERMKGE